MNKQVLTAIRRSNETHTSIFSPRSNCASSFACSRLRVRAEKGLQAVYIGTTSLHPSVEFALGQFPSLGFCQGIIDNLIRLELQDHVLRNARVENLVPLHEARNTR